MFLDADFILKNSFDRKLYMTMLRNSQSLIIIAILDPQEIIRRYKPLRSRGLLEIIINGVCDARQLRPESLIGKDDYEK